MKIALIMLAAGNSRRFGSNKLLYCVDGVPMYQRALETLLKTQMSLEQKEISCTITVVTQYEAVETYGVQTGVQVCRNPHPELGISSSLKIGLQANAMADACLFTVSDQPWLTCAAVEELVMNFCISDREIACLSKDGIPGNPCIFSKKYYPELLSLEGDTGGRRIIKAHPEDTLEVPVKDIRQLTDLDVRPEKDR